MERNELVAESSAVDFFLRNKRGSGRTTATRSPRSSWAPPLPRL